MFQKTLAFRIFFTVSLILIGCFVFLPLLWMINTALKPADKTFTLYFFAGELTLDNIIGILSDKTIMTYLRNSLIVSFLSSFMATLVSSFAEHLSRGLFHRPPNQGFLRLMIIPLKSGNRMMTACLQS